MASITKRLLKRNSAGKRLLVFVIRNSSSWRLDYSSGIRMENESWTERLHVHKEAQNSSELNKAIDALQSSILAFTNRLLVADPYLSPNEVKDRLDEYLNRHKKKDPIKKENHSSGFYTLFEQFIKESAITKTPGTIKTYTRTLGALRKFKPSLRFEDINIEFYYAFIEHLQKVYGMRDNTVGMHIKNLKAFLNDSTIRGINTNLDFRNPKFRAIFEEADTIYLRLEEVERIKLLDLSAKPGMERMRDLFLVGCFTGLRFSDFSQIKLSNIVTMGENRFISLRTLKTSTRVVIPFNKTVLDILDKYMGGIPDIYTNQAMNRILKRIGRLAGLDEPVMIRENRKGISYKRTCQKYQLISSHTARRSFATNAFLAGVPSISIMRITGHRTEKAFMQYIKVSQEENAIQLAGHAFFN